MVRNCTRDEGGTFEVGNQVFRELLSSKAMVVNVAEKSEQDFGRGERESGTGTLEEAVFAYREAAEGINPRACAA